MNCECVLWWWCENCWWKKYVVKSKNWIESKSDEKVKNAQSEVQTENGKKNVEDWNKK